MIHRKRILLIDDEEDFCFFVKNNLEQTDEFSVTYTTNPDKGIGLAKRDSPDLILLDILMPGKDGFKVLEALKNKKNSRTLSIPVIMLTAVGEDEAKLKATQGYCERYITKPVSFETLRSKIYSVLEIKSATR